MTARVRSQVIHPSSEVPAEHRSPRESLALSRAPRRTTEASVAYLNCPRCGLSIAHSPRRVAITNCPRCAGRGRTIVALFSSQLPADLLYADGSVPCANTVADARRRQRRCRVMTRPTSTPEGVELIKSAMPGGRQ